MNEPVITCEHCGRRLTPTDEFCQRCGQSVVADASLVDDSDVNPVLMTANVLRARRQWDLAEAKCSEVLSRKPGNAAAYSILGDISRDRGASKDAIEWYKLALDCSPASTADREKLEALIDAVFSAPPRTITEKARAALRRCFSQAAGTVRSWQRPCALAVLMGAVLIVLLAIATYTIVMGKRMPSQGAAVTAPAGTFSAGPGAQSPADLRNRIAVGPILPTPQEITGEIATLERGLMAELEARMYRVDPACEVLAVSIDPASATAAVHGSLPRLWSRASTRDTVFRAVREIAVATRAWDPRISGLRVRFYVIKPGMEEELGMTGEGTPEQLAKLGKGGPAPAGAPAAAVWWHPEMRP